MHSLLARASGSSQHPLTRRPSIFALPQLPAKTLQKPFQPIPPPACAGADARARSRKTLQLWMFVKTQLSRPTVRLIHLPLSARRVMFSIGLLCIGTGSGGVCHAIRRLHSLLVIETQDRFRSGTAGASNALEREVDRSVARY